MEDIEKIFKNALIKFIIESSETDYSTGYWLGEIIGNHLNISKNDFKKGFIDKINDLNITCE